MEGSKKKEFVTVQGLITPVPAASGSEQAGYQPSSSNDCNDTSVSLARVSDNATSKKKEIMREINEENPFRRSAKIQRSPRESLNVVSMVENETPKNTQKLTTGKVICDRTERMPIPRGIIRSNASSPEVTYRNIAETRCENLNAARDSNYGSPRQEFIMKMRLSEEETLDNCQKVLKKIRSAITKQRNINMDVQNGVSELEELLDVIKDYRRNWRAAEKERELSKQRNADKPQRNDEKDKSITASAKRNASSPAEMNPGKKPKGSIEQEKLVEKPTERKEEKSKGEDILTEEKGVRTGRKPRRRLKKCPDAVIIRPNEGRSYADVLKNLRGNVKPDENEIEVRCIRKTKGGSILLQMEKGGNTDKFRESIKNMLKGEAEVKDLKPRTTLEIRDLDALSTEEEVIAAIKVATQVDTDDISVRLTATNQQEQRRAFVSLHFNVAKELLRMSRIKIGWTNCRIRYRKEIRRCYRCFGIGHLQFGCRETDRKSMELCIRCGEKGHKLKECKNPPKCCFCVQDEKSPTDHLPGARGCKSQEQKAK